MTNLATHTFNISEAIEYGLEEAIMIHHFRFWIMLNRRQKKNFIDGRTWTYQAIKEIAAGFPFWSESQVERILNKLTGKDILIKGNFNKSAYDRTVWYAFKVEEEGFKDEKCISRSFEGEKSISRNREMENTKSGNQFPEIGTPIPDTKTDNKKDTTTPPTPSKGVAAVFFSSLQEIQIPEELKQQLSQEYDEVTVNDAVKYATDSRTHIATTLEACLVWACKNKIKPKPTEQDKIALRRKQAEDLAIRVANGPYASRGMYVEVLRSYVELGFRGGNAEPRCIEYDCVEWDAKMQKLEEYAQC